jgi:hypothetical protein
MSGGPLRALEAAEAGLVQREGGRPRGLPAKEREFFIAPAPVWRACVWYRRDNAQPQGTPARAHRGDPMSAAPRRFRTIRKLQLHGPDSMVYAPLPVTVSTY